MTRKPVDRLPELRDPILIAAFSGWNDAGDAATDAVDHLALIWDATDLHNIDPDDYYDLQVSRPVVRQVDGVLRRVEWPSTLVSYCRLPDADRDVVLVSGIEPNFHWPAFCREIVDIAMTLNTERAVMLGAYTSDIPHTRPVKVTGCADSAEAAAEHGFTKDKYTGSAGITTILQSAFTEAGIPAMTLWATVPHYAANPPQPRASLALLSRLEDVLDTAIPLGKLPAKADKWQAAYDDMTAEDEDMAGYVRDLEELDDAEHSLGDDVDGDVLAAEFERYLRRRGRDERGQRDQR
ncbi:MAG: PAC2 family protein [Gordonia sp. (in: high G+C Gram-positive bacteria)]|uniref:PAC2 family protein n=1 Tax=Gordonia sp. (in: high G+C Gram-positive bacteria) TaxID=84139 RepID=UPI0039E3ACC5